jgi:hypothetical protein
MTETMDLFAEARDRAETGMQRSVDHADRDTPGWSERALEALRRYARIQAEDFTIEKARAAIVLEAPPDQRAFGAVTQSAIRKGYIQKTGGYAAASSSNGSPKPLYRRGPAA